MKMKERSKKLKNLKKSSKYWKLIKEKIGLKWINKNLKRDFQNLIFINMKKFIRIMNMVIMKNKNGLIFCSKIKIWI
jgi:hypothetical protein